MTVTRCDAEALERVQVEREARDERLALAGLHLGDVAFVQRDPAHHLDVEDALVGLAQARLARRGERLEEEALELLAVLEPLPKLDGLRAERLVRELLEVGLERRDVRGLLLQPLEPPPFAEAQCLFEGCRSPGTLRDRVPGGPAAETCAERAHTRRARNLHRPLTAPS